MSMVNKKDLDIIRDSPVGVPMPSDKGVDWFIEIGREAIPENIRWLATQAELGYADKTTKRQAGFRISSADVELVPDLVEYEAVLLGFETNG